MHKWLALAVLLLSHTALAADNQLTGAEKTAGWRLLFDGRTYDGWQDPSKRTPPGDSFLIEDGCLKAVSHPKIVEDLFTRDTFRDFELQFDWRISRAGNSGVKYRIQDHLYIPDGHEKFEDRVKAALLAPRLPRPPKGQDYVIGFEYQLTDNAANSDARAHGPKHQTAALYDVEPPSRDATRAVGEFNHSLLIVHGDHVEHWLNGEKVLDTSLKSPAVAAAMQQRWGADSPVYDLLVHQPHADCPISLQNHDDEAWFKNIKIRAISR
jgi:hypothetical protein